MTQMPPPPGQQPYTMLRPHRGAMILVFGILSWFVCFIFGIVAWTMGNSDLREMDAGRMDPTGRGLTQAGKLLGMIHIIIVLVSFGLVLLWIILAVILGLGAAAASGSGP